MTPTSDAQKRATANHRKKRRRIEILIDPDSPESRALDKLVDQLGSVAAAVKFALRNSG